MKELELSRGLKAIVDDEDYEKVKCYKWHAKSCSNRFYAARNYFINGRRTLLCLHHVILPKEDLRNVDHINGNTLDNRRGNLRYATDGQNRANSVKNSNSSSPYKGITKDIKNGSWTGKWKAQIQINGKRVNLGRFASPELAHSVFVHKHKEVYGEFSCYHNRS